MNKYTVKNCLITGGAGFIGSNFIHHSLRNTPINIINLDLLTYAGSVENLQNLAKPDHYTFIQGNICDQELVLNILRKHQIDTIIHFAAESHVDRSIIHPGAFVNTNLVGTFTLLEAARSYWFEELKLTSNQCRFHHISTDEVYGSLMIDDPAFTETTAYTPNSPYSASKAGSDHLVRSYYHTYGLPVTVSNCSNNYGPYQHPEKFIPTIILSCVQHKTIPVYGDGLNIRDWLYVEDHCRAIDQIIQNGLTGETYNIGGENELNNLEVVEIICNHFDKQFPEYAPHQQLIKFVKDRLGHDRRYAIDITKIKNSLGWHPQESFDSGINKTIDFYLRKLQLEKTPLLIDTTEEAFL